MMGMKAPDHPSYRHLCQLLALFTMLTHQIWSCHVNQVANFGNFQLWPNSALNNRKKSQNPGGNLLYFRSCQPKISPGGGDFRTKRFSKLICSNFRHLPCSGRSSRLVRPFEKNLNLTIIVPT